LLRGMSVLQLQDLFHRTRLPDIHRAVGTGVYPGNHHDRKRHTTFYNGVRSVSAVQEACRR
jgi:hypothetical protein